MNRFDLLSLDKLKLESFDEYREEYYSFGDGESPTRALALACKAKRLISKAGKLFNVLRAETVRIKPKKEQGNLNSRPLVSAGSKVSGF